MIPTVEWKDGIVRLLDQSQLPGRIEIFECHDYKTVIAAIKDMRVRGAPAIGVTAAMGVALGAQAVQVSVFEEFKKAVFSICDDLMRTRPTAVNLFWAIERMKQVVQRNGHYTISELQSLCIREAIAIQQEDITMCKTIGKYGAELIEHGQHILTHCNAGALATAGYGTALGVIRSAWEQGKDIHIFANETRPVLQGARLTTWELMQEGIPVTLITDNMAGAIMREGKIHICLVGADRIAANGDVANKIGTYSVAVLAKAHAIPFYVAAPSSTLDFSSPTGDVIPIEQRPPCEITAFNSTKSIAPEGVSVINPAFDVTPAALITGIITERGVFKPSEIAMNF